MYVIECRLGMLIFSFIRHSLSGVWSVDGMCGCMEIHILYIYSIQKTESLSQFQNTLTAVCRPIKNVLHDKISTRI